VNAKWFLGGGVFAILFSGVLISFLETRPVRASVPIDSGEIRRILVRHDSFSDDTYLKIECHLPSNTLIVQSSKGVAIEHRPDFCK